MKKILFFIILTVRLLTYNCFGQQNKIDSLLILLKTDKSDTNKLSHLNIIAGGYRVTGSYDSAILFANSAIQLSNILLEEITDPKIIQTTKKGEANAYNTLGIVYYYQGNYTDALKNHFASLKIREAIGDKNSIADSYNCIGPIYFQQGNYPDALKYFLASLKTKEAIGNKEGIAAAYNNLGVIYKNMDNYPEALKNYFAALKIWEALGKKNLQGNAYNNIGIIYNHQKNYSEALKYLLASLKIEEALDNKRGLADSYGNIANVYFNQNKYPEALKNNFASLKIKEAIGDKSGIANTYMNIGTIYFEQKKFKETENYFNKSKDLSTEIGHKLALKNVYDALSKLDSAKGDYKGSYENHKKYIEFRDSIDNEKTRKKIVQQQMTYEFEKKEATTKANQDKKDVIILEEKKKQRLVIYFISAGMLLLLFLIVFITRGYRQKIQSNATITLKNEEISRQKANIVGQEEERRRIAQELHDGIGGTLAGTKLNLIRISSSYAIPELESVITNIGDTCKEIRTISHNLAPPALTSNNTFVEVMKEAIRKFITPDKLKINFEYSAYEELNNIPKNIQANIYRIVQELLTNITKHANAAKVEVDLSKQGNELFLLVEDNGKGFDLKVENHKGIGMQNIESRVKLLNGTILFDSKIGRGTAVNIQIPLG